MNLTKKIFKTFTIIFLAQLAVVGMWTISIYSSQDIYPSSIVDSLTKVDGSILEGIVLQNKMGSPLARDLVAYKLLELNNVDSAEFLKTISITGLISKFNLKRCIRIQEATICSKPNNMVALSFIPLRLEDKIVGYLKLEKSLKLVEEVNRKILSTIGITVLVVFIINGITLFMLWWKFLKPETSRLIQVIENEKEDPTLILEEYKRIQEIFLEVLERVKSAESEKLQLETQLQKVNLATQVAHDIRSPLEVLKGIKSDIDLLPEDSRRRMHMSINRIEEISFNLLKNHKQDIIPHSIIYSEDLLSILKNVTIEKSIEFRKSPSIEILESFDYNSYGLYSRIQGSTLKSIISNIINNGIDSSKGRAGVISIGLYSKDDTNVICIADYGNGIPKEIGSKIFNKGFTTKSSGNGLGLYNAKQDIEAVGGSIDFDSEIGKGTTFTITLPKSERPASFINSIDAFKYEKIIVLDDDLAFHEVWKKRLDGIESKVEHIHSVKEMLSRYQTLHPKILLLSDFELMDKNYDGIDTILKLNHSAHSVLVTARDEEQAIQDRCIKARIKLLPKTLVNYVKVNKGDSEVLKLDLVGHVILIDDDRLVQINWASYCRKKGLSFHGYKSIDEFIAASTVFDKSSKIYIDSNLENGIKGEVESEKIFQLGFFNLYLATGYEKGWIKKPAWIKDIYSKRPEDIG